MSRSGSTSNDADGGGSRTRGSVDLAWGGEALVFLPAPALWWPRRATLFVADLHLGKEHVLQSAGLPVPGGTTADDLDRLSRAVASTHSRRLVILGDFWHGVPSRADDVLAQLASWRARLGDTEVLLVRGNHDRGVGDPPSGLAIDTVEGPVGCGPFTLRHEPAGRRPTGADQSIAGHLHPVVRLRGPGRDRLRVPCFWLTPEELVLPSFGGLTGGAEIRPHAADRIFAVGEVAVVEVSLLAPGEAP